MTPASAARLDLASACPGACRRGWRLFIACLLAASSWGCTDGSNASNGEACDPVAPATTGCPDGMLCRVVSGGETACVVPEPPNPAGSGCTLWDCDAGRSCLEVEGHLACHAMCRTDSDCGAGRCAFEVDRPEAGAEAWGVCAEACDPTRSCPQAEGTCVPTTAPGFPVCVSPGDRPEGAGCGGARCQTGLACLSLGGDRVCSRLCVPGADCDDDRPCGGIIAGYEGLLGYCSGG
jgi:hypothetical protein